jgi:hypothetical protein
MNVILYLFVVGLLLSELIGHNLGFVSIQSFGYGLWTQQNFYCVYLIVFLGRGFDCHPGRILS